MTTQAKAEAMTVLVEIAEGKENKVADRARAAREVVHHNLSTEATGRAVAVLVDLMKHPELDAPSRLMAAEAVLAHGGGETK